MADRILFLETPDIQKTPVGEKNEYTAAEKQKLAGIEAGAQKNTVDSVNGKTGPVKLNASDVHALPDSTVIPPTVTEQTVAGWGFTKNTGTYSKPSGGIPESDLAEGVIPTIPITSVSVNGVKQTPVGGNVDIDVPTGGSVEEKTLAQRGFRYKVVQKKSDTDAGFYQYIGSADLPSGVSIGNYVPEIGSIVGGYYAQQLPSGATLCFRLANYYSKSWPIMYAGNDGGTNRINAGERFLLQFDGNAFQVVSVVRDPIDPITDLNLTGIQEIDLSSAAQSLSALLAVNKTAITATDGEKTTFYRGNNFASVVYDVGSAFSNRRLPVVSLGEWAKLPVTEVQYDAETDNSWFSAKMSETEVSGTSLIGYTHEIAVALVGIVIHTQKYEIDVQTLPSGS